ncbi:uncharacterized protein LOC118189827 [Stegodyphus dumicola]|uniref:uncharacterized protein LOC118189827 n=1 Tax=Stegodyphus dumicola TaxID=202533 RepID=UPI0015B2144B|nr:uncharacterized protein LOC118189827 [Stegodyphus dumicola]XP_035216392.1 uncharacterized protein LOC118189827 [Stegodyphus dumicola]XP_035216393.1 uncharacterized protein LOC118189827 [Stegodyphus dumicola]
MDLEVACKMGFLFIPPHSFLRKTWTKRYCALYNASHHGIQRLELFESEDAYVKQNPTKIIPLTDCWKVTAAPQKHQPNVFEVRTKNSSYQFSADTFQEMSDWLASLQTVAFGKIRTKSVMSVAPIIKEEKQEENLLYSSMDEPEIYTVKVVPTDASLRNNLKGDYKLIITSVNLSVAESCPLGRIGKIILTWPYRHIRRYGCSADNFSFEAGRKCASGEGLFTFSSVDGIHIFQSVDAHVSALKSTQSETDIPTSPNFNDEEFSFLSTKDHDLEKNDSSLQMTPKFDQKYVMPDCENEIHSAEVHKTLPPVAKPPRKSKSSANTSSRSNCQIAMNISAQNESNVTNFYEELHLRNSPNNLSLNSDILESQNSSSKYFDTESVSSVSYVSYPESCTHLETDSFSSAAPYEDALCHSADNLEVSDSCRKGSGVQPSCTINNYENCEPFHQNAFSSSKSLSDTDHIYGKLLNTKRSSLSNMNAYGSIIIKNVSANNDPTSPVYSNVPLRQLMLDHSRHGTSENEPEHFLKNDAEYAQVFKKN